MSDILIVSTSNVCRGPMLEAALRERLRRAAPQVTVASRGINVVAPARANPHMALLVKGELGVDVSAHVSRLLTGEDLRAARVVLAVTGEHKRYVEAVYPHCAGKTRAAADLDEARGDDMSVYRDCLAALVRFLDELDNGKAWY